MKEASVISIAVRNPVHTESTENIIPSLEKWLEPSDERLRKKAVKIYQMSNIDRRYSIMPLEEVFKETSFEDKNNAFIQSMKMLCAEALKEALEKANFSGQELDAIITVSCTGFMIPSMDAFLINELNLNKDITRLPVTEMGCAGGTSAMIYAHQIIQGNPEKKVAIVCFESPTSTFQHKDRSMTNIVSSALFGDGVAALILGPSEESSPQIIDSKMYHFKDQEQLMGFELTNSGLKMVLDIEVPEVIEEHFSKIIEPFLERNQIGKKDLDHLIFHPGGRKIIELVESEFRETGQSLEATKNVLRSYGNMSSATVIFVLNEYIHKKINAGELGLMLSFGPGFSAQLVLLRWN